MLLLILLYGLFALVREFLAIKYYRCVYAGLAVGVMVLGFLIELLDFSVLAGVGIKLMQGCGYSSFIPFISYGFFGAIGGYIGVKHGNYKNHV